jgi:hypothetical protein
MGIPDSPSATGADSSEEANEDSREETPDVEVQRDADPPEVPDKSPSPEARPASAS